MYVGKVTVQPFTTKKPITLMGYEAGVCWNADVSNDEANFRRGLQCVESNHGRVMEFPQIYLTIEGFSARVIRELYTHIAGGPTRLQASTRRINYQDFDYITPPSIESNKGAKELYDNLMYHIGVTLQNLEDMGVPREDAALGLPLGMESTITLRTNLRNLVDMSHQRLCGKAYHEFRVLFLKILDELKLYDFEYRYLIDEKLFCPKCVLTGKCPEKDSCGYINTRSFTKQ